MAPSWILDSFKMFTGRHAETMCMQIDIPSGQEKKNLMASSLEQSPPWGPVYFDIKWMTHFLFFQLGAATSVQRNGGTLGQGRQCSEPYKFIKLCLFVWCLSCSTRSGYLCNTVQHGSRDCMYILLSKFDCMVSRKNEFLKHRDQPSFMRNWYVKATSL